MLCPSPSAGGFFGQRTVGGPVGGGGVGSAGGMQGHPGSVPGAGPPPGSHHHHHQATGGGVPGGDLVNPPGLEMGFPRKLEMGFSVGPPPSAWRDPSTLHGEIILTQH